MDPTTGRVFFSRPWGWVPSIYLIEGLPNAIITVLTATMYTNMGIHLDTMVFYTSLIGFAWVFKPFWSPFIDLIKTKRWWTLTMQLLIAVGMAFIAIFLTTANFFVFTIITFWIIAFLSATHDIAADGYYMMALDDKAQADYVGVRNAFYKIAVLLGTGGFLVLAGNLETSTGDVPFAWSMIFWIVAAVTLAIFLWNCFAMPRAERDHPVKGVTIKLFAKDFASTFGKFFLRPHIWIALAFMLLYRLPEALCLKIVPPFLLDSTTNGGLELSTAESGVANGIVGTVCSILGGILGGVLIGKYGLRRCLWPMALALTLPCAVYLLFALYQPSNFIYICIGIGVEQFGYMLGYTAIVMYLIYFCAGENQTSHFSFCTAFMYLGIVLPQLAVGWLYNKLGDWGEYLEIGHTGYIFFFTLVMVSCLVSFFSVILVKPTIKAEK